MIMLMTAVFKNHLLNRNVTPLWLLRGCCFVALSFFILSACVASSGSRPQDGKHVATGNAEPRLDPDLNSTAFMLQVRLERSSSAS